MLLLMVKQYAANIDGSVDGVMSVDDGDGNDDDCHSFRWWVIMIVVMMMVECVV